ncbi:MAG TPA: Tudor-knot domain-containing protein [Polyangiaceae bacterium]
MYGWDRRLLVLAMLSMGLGACKRPYRVGEYVLVEWEGAEYPAYIVERKGSTRYRVHFDGYDSRWDQDVGLDRIRGRAVGPVRQPPPPQKVRIASGQVTPNEKGSASPPAPYNVGDKIKVRWRGSPYAATVIGVVSNDRFLVHYEGHEDAWDETVPVDRIISRR